MEVARGAASDIHGLASATGSGVDRGLEDGGLKDLAYRVETRG